jgi:hypothetical protein
MRVACPHQVLELKANGSRYLKFYTNDERNPATMSALGNRTLSDQGGFFPYPPVLSSEKIR